jgi:Uma2 family endonuclease
VIEISDTTLPADRERLNTYESARIKEYWIIDVFAKVVRIHSLRADHYTSRSKELGTASPQNLPDLVISLPLLG